jgi:uncharacterized protein YkwD
MNASPLPTVASSAASPAAASSHLRLRLSRLACAANWAAACCVAACGGGGSDSASSSTTAAPVPGPVAAPAPAPTPAPVPAPAPAPAVVAGSTCGIPDFSATVLARVNQLRAAGADCRGGGKFAAAAAVVWNGSLTQAAEAHSQDMATKNFFSHTGSNGSTLVTRVDATGYAWSSLGENIAAGYAGIEAVMTGWMASDGHCANVMNPAYDQIGLVCVAGTAASDFRTYWTMDLARAR